MMYLHSNPLREYEAHLIWVWRCRIEPNWVLVNETGQKQLVDPEPNHMSNAYIVSSIGD